MFQKTLIFFLILATSLIVSGCRKGEMPPDQEVTYEEIEELIEEIDEEYKVRASCNVIAEKSQCVDYIGSFWDQVGQPEHNCEGVGVYSKDACPYTELGGCKTTGGTITESIIWSYSHGGQPLSVEEAGYMAGACNANPAGEWVFPEDNLSNQE